MWHIGFTGTRHRMTPLQQAGVAALLQQVTGAGGFRAQHGDGIGADAEPSLLEPQSQDLDATELAPTWLSL